MKKGIIGAVAFAILALGSFSVYAISSNVKSRAASSGVTAGNIQGDLDAAPGSTAQVSLQYNQPSGYAEISGLGVLFSPDSDDTFNSYAVIQIPNHTGPFYDVDPSNNLITFGSNNFAMTLDDPVSVTTPGAVVEYATNDTPCGGFLRSGILGYADPNGCTPTVWTVTPPSDLSTVRFVRISVANIAMSGGAPLQQTINAGLRLRALRLSDYTGQCYSAGDNMRAQIRVSGYTTSTDTSQSASGSASRNIRAYCSRISGTVWNDVNKNGLIDVGEARLLGATAELLHTNGTSVLDGGGNPVAATTDEAGVYNLVEPLGDYKVRITPAEATMAPTILKTEANGNKIDSTGVTQTINVSTIANRETTVQNGGFYVNEASNPDLDPTLTPTPESVPDNIPGAPNTGQQ